MPAQPKVKLIGADGNAFNIIGLCLRSARKAGWTGVEVDELKTRLFAAGSYDKLLQIVMETFDVS